VTRISVSEARARGYIPKNEQRKPKLKTAVQWDARIIPEGVWLQIPEIPPSLNVWLTWHWSKQNRYKHDLYDAVSALVMAYKLPKVKFAYITITYYFKTRQRRDIVDNFCPKFLCDSLVNGGLLEDDRSDWIKVELVAEYDKERPRCEITIKRED
jgi:hypothetical protein